MNNRETAVELLNQVEKDIAFVNREIKSKLVSVEEAQQWIERINMTIARAQVHATLAITDEPEVTWDLI